MVVFFSASAEKLSSRAQILAFTIAPPPPTTGSLFIRLFQNIISEPRHPDLILKHKEEQDIGFGEVSHTSCYKKDTGDLCRCVIWSKRALGQLVTKYEGIDDIAVLFMQVIDRTCSIYQIRRCGTICVASLLGSFSIVVSLDDLLAKLEDNAFDWLLFSRAFDNRLSLIRGARERKKSSTTLLRRIGHTKSLKNERGLYWQSSCLKYKYFQNSF